MLQLFSLVTLPREHSVCARQAQALTMGKIWCGRISPRGISRRDSFTYSLACLPFLALVSSWQKSQILHDEQAVVIELSTCSLSGMSLLHKGYDRNFSSRLLLACLLSPTPLVLSATASQKHSLDLGAAGSGISPKSLVVSKSQCHIPAGMLL